MFWLGWLIVSGLVRAPWWVGWYRVSWQRWKSRKEWWGLIGKGDQEGCTCLVQITA